MRVNVGNIYQIFRDWLSVKHRSANVWPFSKVGFACVTLLTVIVALSGCVNEFEGRPPSVPVSMTMTFPQNAPSPSSRIGQLEMALQALVPLAVGRTVIGAEPLGSITAANAEVRGTSQVTNTPAAGAFTRVAVPDGLQISTTEGVVGIKTATDVAAGSSHTCARLVDGTVECWGRNTEGQLGNGKSDTSSNPVPVPIFGITTATAITTGGYHSCAHLQDHTLLCWGNNNQGQLGNISTAEFAPVQVQGITASAVVAGGHYSCAVLEEGAVRCWGYNAFGQLGNGTTVNSSSPVAVTGITTATTIAAGAGHTCARLANQTVMCWGYNNEGQLGNTLANTSTVPVLVPGIHTATLVSAGARHSCARLADGTVQCWGRNIEGQLGNGKTDTSSNPVAVIGLTTAITVATGGSHTCALMTDKTVQCWGSNSKGQLGDGTTTNSSVPVPVLGITTATAITTGGSHSCARLENSTLRCWGDNGLGQLGTRDCFAERTNVMSSARSLGVMYRPAKCTLRGAPSGQERLAVLDPAAGSLAGA